MAGNYCKLEKTFLEFLTLILNFSASQFQSKFLFCAKSVPEMHFGFLSEHLSLVAEGTCCQIPQEGGRSEPEWGLR